MRALPLTKSSRAGGRPRRSRAPGNLFAEWLMTCGRSAEQIAKELKVSPSSIYNARNSYFKPGRKLAVAIEELTTDPKTGVSAVPVSSWEEFRARPRPTGKAGE